MKRDNYGLRTHFPRLQHGGFADDSPEDQAEQAAHTHKKVNILRALEEETSELRDELRTFNFFRFSLPRLQGAALEILPELVWSTENTESCPRNQETDKDEIQQLGSELQNTEKSETGFHIVYTTSAFRTLTANMRYSIYGNTVF